MPPSSEGSPQLPQFRKDPELLATGCWLPATGYWLLATGYRLPTTDDWRLATGDWRLATGDWRLATGYWLLGTDYWLLILCPSPSKRKYPSVSHQYCTACLQV